MFKKVIVLTYILLVIIIILYIYSLPFWFIRLHFPPVLRATLAVNRYVIIETFAVGWELPISLIPDCISLSTDELC